MSENARVKVVCFDLGGVLVRVGRTWREVMTCAGVPASRDGALDAPLDACPGFAAYQKGALDEAAYLAELACFAGLEDPADARRAHEAILMAPYPGVEALVDDLHAAGIHTGCLSNTNALHWGVLRSPARNPAIARLRTAVASHLVREEKPGEGIFRAFERAAGCGPADVLFFDDHPVNVRGAVAAGWRAHAIDPLGDPAVQMRGLLVAAGVLRPGAPVPGSM
jgi:HAD superfamily hydrolase (TIGR01509 family)